MQILNTILSYHSTPTLLKVAPTNKHIHSLIIQILHQRILSASALQPHEIIFECYNPSLRLGTPHMICAPLTTLTNAPPSSTLVCTDGLSLSRLNDLYTILKPTKSKKEQDQPRPHPAGGMLAPLTAIFPALPPDATSVTSSSSKQPKSTMGDLVTQQIHLESHELFTQLCSNIKIVKPGPRQGVYKSCVLVGEGILRIWRQWLSSQPNSAGNSEKPASEDTTGEEYQKMVDAGVLWIDTRKNFGLRMRVEKIPDAFTAPTPSMSGMVDEDEDVGYILGYEGPSLPSIQTFRVELSSISVSESLADWVTL